jgi:hypothetical protein
MIMSLIRFGLFMSSMGTGFWRRPTIPLSDRMSRVVKYRGDDSAREGSDSSSFAIRLP